jgi:aminoglycoside 6-adenylyltransferase
MRTEQEMLDLILQYAQADDNIRAVLMNGSRANPNIQPDRMQDFDVVYYVRELAPLVHNLAVPAAFGELAILQLPDEMGESAKNPTGSYAYLMQFRDGNRIDLTICPLDALADTGEDSLTVVLMDKDNAAPKLPTPSEDSYLPKPPSAKQYADCCNEFWWLMPYVAKALWRGELVNAQFFLELRRRELHKMLDWYYGTLTGYTQSPGKLGKRWQAAFGPELWRMIEQTYADHQPKNIWRALYAMGDVLRQAAQAVAAHHGYAYPAGDDERVNELVRGIEGMGKDV